MIKDAVKKMVQLDAPVDRATVISVDKTACTCVVQTVADERTIEGVKLNPIECDGDPEQLGFILFPAVGSFVIVGQVDNDRIDVCVLRYTILESISFTNTALKLMLDAAGNINLNAVKITFNNGNNGGIPLVNPLVAVILKLQQQVNQLITTFNAHTHGVVGAATSPTTTPGPGVTAKTIKASDIASTQIIQ
jgi:hypothetical protein